MPGWVLWPVALAALPTFARFAKGPVVAEAALAFGLACVLRLTSAHLMAAFPQRFLAVWGVGYEWDGDEMAWLSIAFSLRSIRLQKKGDAWVVLGWAPVCRLIG